MTEIQKNLNRFLAKHELDFDFWVADREGEVALCSDMFFHYNDMLHDLQTKRPKGLIIDWYYATMHAKSYFDYKTFLTLLDYATSLKTDYDAKEHVLNYIKTQ